MELGTCGSAVSFRHKPNFGAFMRVILFPIRKGMEAGLVTTRLVAVSVEQLDPGSKSIKHGADVDTGLFRLGLEICTKLLYPEASAFPFNAAQSTVVVDLLMISMLSFEKCHP